MNAATEKKPTITLDKKPTIGEASGPATSEAPTITLAEKLSAAVVN